MKKYLIGISLIVILSGCGGGGSDTPKEQTTNPPQQQGNNPPPFNENSNQPQPPVNEQNNPPISSNNEEINTTLMAKDTTVFVNKSSATNITIASLIKNYRTDTTYTTTITTPPTHGEAQINGSDILYTPTTGYSGSDTIAYSVSSTDGFSGSGTISLTLIDPNGGFTTGQKANLILSAPNFNDSGYLNSSGDGLFFNHPQSIASDDKHLILVDGRNNRVLIWNTLPTGNSSPDIVLGQTNLVQNNSGNTLDKMNWPVGVTTDGTKLVVTDASNDRILVWNSFPTTSGQSADFAIPMGWPWDVWTNGTKLMATNTMGSSNVLVWDSFPTSSNAPASYSFSSNGEFGTPRGITTDGNSFMLIADHNGHNRSDTQDGSYSFYWQNILPSSSSDSSAECILGRGHIEGDVTKDGKLVVLYNQNMILIYNTLPTTCSDQIQDSADVRIDLQAYNMEGLGLGGESSRVIAVDSDSDGVDDKLYVSLYNANKIIGFNSIPTSNDATPDFVIGASGLNENTLVTNRIITNPAPVCNGNQLFVGSGYDNKFYGWNSYPTTTNQAPDFVIKNLGLTELELFGNRMIGRNRNSNQVVVWNNLPTTSSDMPDKEYNQAIGNTSFTQGGGGADTGGVAIDDKFMYISNGTGGKIYVWDITSSLPEQNTNPTYTITMPDNAPAFRLHSDGEYLTVASEQALNVSVVAYRVADIIANGSSVTELGIIGSSDATQDTVQGFNQAKKAVSVNGKLIVSDINHGRVVVWNSITEALVNQSAPDAIIGQDDREGATNGTSDSRLFWPHSLCFDGANLWVGEMKFSGRILRFTTQ